MGIVVTLIISKVSPWRGSSKVLFVLEYLSIKIYGLNLFQPPFLKM